MIELVHPVLLCGGSGTRLWPLSRKSFPKQFAQVTGPQSLFQKSALRLTGSAFAAPVIVTNDDFRFVVVEQLAACAIAPQAIVIEPEGRNTAPAVLAAALVLAAQNPDALMLVAPSDHVIPSDDEFRAAIQAAIPCAVAGNLVTFGVTPTRPEMGYGYLELVDRTATSALPQALTGFVEKPDAARAAHMVASGRYLWNAGIFLFTAQSLIDACRNHAIDLVEPVEAAVVGAVHDLGFTRLASDAWSRVPNISLDYAVMERAKNLAVMPYDAGWSDLGSWDAVWQECKPDATGNVVSDHALAIDCRNTLLRSESPRLEVVGIGLEDILVVATNDAVLVTRKSEAQRVKEAVEELKQRGATQADTFPIDRRPWGSFESLVIGDRFQVKCIKVQPGASLSLQSHHHRSEHWIVVEGTARVTVNENVQLLSENQSVYIPLGSVHRLENPGKVPLTLIEVQTGSYLGEDDIVRYDDLYARC